MEIFVNSSQRLASACPQVGSTISVVAAAKLRHADGPVPAAFGPAVVGIDMFGNQRPNGYTHADPETWRPPVIT